jgi:hypothetical protein
MDQWWCIVHSRIEPTSVTMVMTIATLEPTTENISQVNKPKAKNSFHTSRVFDA